MGEMGEAGTAVGAAVTGHPVGLGLSGVYHAAQYGVGKLMNSPGFVDWLMRGRGFAPVQDAPAAAATVPAVNRLIPAAVASGAMKSSWDWENNRPKGE